MDTGEYYSLFKPIKRMNRVQELGEEYMDKYAEGMFDPEKHK